MAKVKKEKRFECILSESVGFDTACKIIKDKNTGVLYLSCPVGLGGGITPLLDRDGKPLIETNYTE
ncbi:MAG: DUF6440 family protein [Oscillospiraceae bacterium]|nr:DUF6440 family protein [Oscillospiraceae bacterium]